MSVFTEIPSSKGNIAKRKILFGVGINDAPYQVRQTKRHKDNTSSYLTCPKYSVWVGMLKRCYSKGGRSYEDCYVTESWHLFSNFAKWMDQQGDITGMQLDKDLKVVGNRIYSPETCLFIPVKLNKLIRTYALKETGLPIGVYFIKKANRFSAQADKYIGCFKTVEEAHQAYLQHLNTRLNKFKLMYPDLALYINNHLTLGI